MRFTIVVRKNSISAIAEFSEDTGLRPVGKRFELAEFKGEAYEAACAEIAKHMAMVRQGGCNDFRFAKTDDVELAVLTAVAENISSRIPGTTVASHRAHAIRIGAHATRSPGRAKEKLN